MVKHQSLWRVIADVTTALGGESLRVVDFWDGDYFAVGIAAADKDYPLVYVSTHAQKPGFCSYQIEVDASGKTSDQHDGVSTDQLVVAVKRHVGRR